MTERAQLRIGVTMRVVAAESYDEPRDALAHDWARALAELLPSDAWMPLPNAPDEVAARIQTWGLNAFILTGGNDLGGAPTRDKTEAHILHLAAQRNLPVLGVCRGLQMIVRHYGGRTYPAPDEGHAGTKHAVRLLDRSNEVLEVNSFHHHLLGGINDLPPDLTALAVDAEGNVEAVRHRTHRQLGIMWHPERPNPAAAYDRRLFRELFEHHG